MYTVEFYEDVNGVSELWDFLEELRVKSATSKDARIQHKQISLYIQLLQDSGTRLPENITKHLVEDIWELRPGNNRVFYFCWRENKFIRLHQFRKSRRKRHGARSSAPKRNGMTGFRAIRRVDL